MFALTECSTSTHTAPLQDEHLQTQNSPRLVYASTILVLRPNRKHRGLLALGIGRKPPRASFLSLHLRLSFPLIPTCNYRKYKSSQAISKEVPGRMTPATCSPHITAKLLEDKEITWFPQHLTFFKALLSALYSSRGWRFRGEQNRKHSIPVEK